MNQSVRRGTLAERYRKDPNEGVLDVKFLLKNEEDYGRDEAIKEHDRLYKAFAAGRSEPLDLGDLKWK
jgi:hypothetical protein